jgi:hypothetical protein
MLCLRLAFLTGSQCSNWGSLASKLSVNKWHKFKGKPKTYCRCEVADEPVVVSKARPVKASNGVEDKTKPTISIMSDRVIFYQKCN